MQAKARLKRVCKPDEIDAAKLTNLKSFASRDSKKGRGHAVHPASRQHLSHEDIGITLGQAFKQALGDKQGIMRYGHAYVPLDEALSRVVIDFSGRPGLEYRVDFLRPRIGQFDVDLIREFFQGFVNHAPASLHIDNLQGRNAHHVAETLFKAFGRALRFAVSRDERMQGVIPSTKGSL